MPEYLTACTLTCCNAVRYYSQEQDARSCLRPCWLVNVVRSNLLLACDCTQLSAFRCRTGKAQNANVSDPRAEGSRAIISGRRARGVSTDLETLDARYPRTYSSA